MSALGRHSQEETELRKGDSSEPFKRRRIYEHWRNRQVYAFGLVMRSRLVGAIFALGIDPPGVIIGYAETTASVM